MTLAGLVMYLTIANGVCLYVVPAPVPFLGCLANDFLAGFGGVMLIGQMAGRGKAAPFSCT